MQITNTLIYLETFEIEEGMKYAKPPKVKVSYEIISETLFRTYCTIKLFNSSEEFEKYTSPYFYSKKVDTGVDVPANVPVKSNLSVEVTVYAQESSIAIPTTVAQLTESVSYPKYSIVTEVSPQEFSGGFLKAFCNFSELPDLEVYCTWEKSTDGLNFEPIDISNHVPVHYKAIRNVTQTSESLTNPDNELYVGKPAYKVVAYSENDLLTNRLDILTIEENVSPGTVYSFKMFTLKELSTPEDVTFGDDTVKCSYEEDIVLGYKQYIYLAAPKSTVVYSDLPNSASGKLHYSGNVAYSYGTDAIRNNVLASEVGEIITPLSRVIPLPAQNYAPITTIVAWRDYIIAANASEMFLISKVEGGFTSKIISTFVGIPAEDANCVRAVTNGIIFKAGAKVYMFYPNMYSSDDAMLNLTDLSTPVESLITEYSETSKHLPFAFSTETAYYLIMPNSNGAQKSTCLKYTYSTRVWTYYEYPVLFVDFYIKNIDCIILYGYYDNRFIEYTFGDYDTDSTQSFGDQVLTNRKTPISFTLDSGQKSDKLNYTRQFVESKFNLATLHEKDCFPMRVTVHIDGMPYVTVKDVNTDSAFWKTANSEMGTLTTDFTSNNSEIFNVFRQMFLRYSGKGRSVRHIIEGESMYPFKLYEINYRYKNLNVKQ